MYKNPSYEATSTLTLPSSDPGTVVTATTLLMSWNGVVIVANARPCAHTSVTWDGNEDLTHSIHEFVGVGASSFTSLFQKISKKKFKKMFPIKNKNYTHKWKINICLHWGFKPKDMNCFRVRGNSKEGIIRGERDGVNWSTSFHSTAKFIQTVPIICIKYSNYCPFLGCCRQKGSGHIEC